MSGEEKSRSSITRPVPFVVSTHCVDIVHDKAISRRLWEWSRLSDAIYNQCLEHLKVHRHEPLKSDPDTEQLGLQGWLTEWRAAKLRGFHELPLGIARGAAAHAHGARARWEATQAEHAKAVLDADAAGSPIPRRVQRAHVTDGPRFRSRRERERESQCGFTAARGVARVAETRRKLRVCGLVVRLAHSLPAEGEVVSAQVVDRTPARFARAGCAPEDRTFAVHVQMRVPVAPGPEVKRVRSAPGMRDEHLICADEIVRGVAAPDNGGVRTATTAMPDGSCRVLHALTPAQAEQAARGFARAKRMEKGTRKPRPGQPMSRARADAQAVRKHTTQRAQRQRRDAVCKDAKATATHPDVRALNTDGVGWDPLGRSAAGTSEAPGKNVAAKRGLNRVMRWAAPAETTKLFVRAAQKAGLWIIEGDPYATSTTCSRCGHRASENRKSQAEFLCVECGHEANADDDAALVAQQRGRHRLAAYFKAIVTHQRREGVASKRARGRYKHVPVLHVRDEAPGKASPKPAPKPDRPETRPRSPQGSARANEQL